MNNDVQFDVSVLDKRWFSGKGSPLLKPSIVKEILPKVLAQGYFVNATEVFEIKERDVRTPLRIDVSIMGLRNEALLEKNCEYGKLHDMIQADMDYAHSQDNDFEVIIWLCKQHEISIGRGTKL